jgi:phosphate transport system substrate-binding protein
VTTIRGVALLAATLAVLATAAGCGGRGDDTAADTTAQTAGQGLSGRIEADGSSTVGPYTTAAAERFRDVEPDVQITVGVSGTGGGFERFCRGETDISNASRPIKDEEAKICKDAASTTSSSRSRTTLSLSSSTETTTGWIASRSSS